MSDDLKAIFAHYLQDFEDLPGLQIRLLHVLQSLPKDVQQDFLHDPRFSVSLDNYQRGRGSTVFMACPGSHSERSRSVILKPLLAECSEAFAYYVIAHEFAHAFLHNGPWGEISDVEEAADALSANWGFERPATTPWTKQ